MTYRCKNLKKCCRTCAITCRYRGCSKDCPGLKRKKGNYFNCWNVPQPIRTKPKLILPDIDKMEIIDGVWRSKQEYHEKLNEMIDRLNYLKKLMLKEVFNG